MAHGLGAEDRVAVQFDQFATMIEAAKQGLGAALVPRFLIGGELRSGSLVPLPQSQAGRFGSYYLVWPEAGAEYPPLVALRDWLAEEIANR
jgi:DNA-binding transcriptional LysR family regulator